ncbi:uncharacterized protein LOC117227367 isoform X3 [Megalopta genalis]|uniref:uncharacterized protein LOC117227367 isoform X3 n=1 Tax=Megalopta genalis TaxID=115081 RepID=UPI003FD14969
MKVRSRSFILRSFQMLGHVIVCYLSLLSTASGIKNITRGVSRHLRSIGFPEGSAMGIFFALGVPVDIPNKSIIFSFYFEANYGLPGEWNSSYYGDGPYLWKRSLDRQLVYRVLANKLESAGYSGEGCLLKMICETANEPLSNNGVLGDILQILFTPSSSQDEDLPSEIVEAEYAEDCANYHAMCPQSPLTLISRYGLKD